MSVVGKTTQGLAVVLLLVALPGCTSGAPDRPPPSSTPTVSAVPTGGPPTPAESGSLRKRLVDGLSTTNPSRARLVETGQLTVVSTKWLSGWQIVDVVNSTLAHPQRFYLALSGDGTVLSLNGNTDNFNRVAGAADRHIGSAKVATEIATTFLDTNRTFLKASYRIEHVDDISWRSTLTADQTRARRQVVSTYGPKIAKPQAHRSGAGWRIAVWMVYDHQLIRHDVDLGVDGVVTDHPQTVFDGLPTPDSI